MLTDMSDQMWWLTVKTCFCLLLQRSRADYVIGHNLCRQMVAYVTQLSGATMKQHSMQMIAADLVTLLARSLAPPIMSLGFVPRGSFRQLPVECRYCLLQFAYYTLSALHFIHLLRKIYFISVLYTSIRKIKILLKLT